MRILGIDSATPCASVALLENDRLLARRRYPDKHSADGLNQRNHAAFMVPLISDVLREAGLSCGDLDRIAVSIGPGSFTGVRIGLSTAKGIAFASGLPVVGVSTLMAYAMAVEQFEVVCPLLDARKKEVYMAVFRRQSGNCQRLTEDSVVPVGGVAQQLANHVEIGKLALTGGGAKIYGSYLRDALGAKVVTVEEPEDFCVATAVARLAGRAMADSGAVDLGALIPAYVRLSEAESKRAGAANLSN